MRYLNKLKYLKTFESNDEWGFDIQLVKDIIVELKDNYPQINGEFHHNEKSNGGTLKLFCKPDIDNLGRMIAQSIIGEYDYTIDYMKKKNEFISSVTEICERISIALDREIKVVGIYDFDSPTSDGYININIMHK